MKHFFLSASGAPVWGRCSLAAQMMALYPSVESVETREGEAAHWYAQQVLNGVNIPLIAPNGIIITDEMRECAAYYVTDIRARLGEHAGSSHGAEQFVYCRRIHPTLCAGTLDYYIWIPAQNLLIDWNYKFGHRDVQAFENLQEIVYLSGLLDALEINGDREQQVKIEVRIVQPRCYTGSRKVVKVWRTKATALRPIWNDLAQRASESLEATPTATTGGHCIDCSGRHACPAAARAGAAAMDYSEKNALPDPLSATAIGYELQLLERAAVAIETRRGALEDLAKHTILHDKKLVPGYTLEPTFGRLTWSANPDAVRALGAKYGVNLTKPDAFITPTQAINLSRGAIGEAVLKDYAERPASGLKLVRQDPNTIRRILESQ